MRGYFLTRCAWRNAARLTLAYALAASALGATLTACDPADDAGTPSSGTGTRIVAAQGGAVAAGATATLQIPPGALAADTDITIRVLPMSNGSAGEVFEFGPAGLRFTRPATLSIRNDIVLTAKQTLAVAHLEGASFLALAGSQFTNGVASAPIEHFSKYSTLVVEGMVEEEQANEPPVSTMTVKVGAETYTFETKDALGTAGPDGPKWSAAGLFAATDEAPDWPAANPSLKLKVLFSDVAKTTGFAPGTYDLASAGLTNLVVFLSSSPPGQQGEGPQPYGYYSSSSTVCDAESDAASIPASGASGAVTVAKYLPGAGGAADVRIDNAVLPTCQVAEGFPATVTIVSAHLIGTW